jgi:hypothetical protein
MDEKSAELKKNEEWNDQLLSDLKSLEDESKQGIFLHID